MLPAVRSFCRTKTYPVRRSNFNAGIVIRRESFSSNVSGVTSLPDPYLLIIWMFEVRDLKSNRAESSRRRPIWAKAGLTSRYTKQFFLSGTIRCPLYDDVTQILKSPYRPQSIDNRPNDSLLDESRPHD
ncbi:unnamed protein product, partial [Nesidiocoris tenuis]